MSETSTVSPRMTRIEKLMSDLEAGPECVCTAPSDAMRTADEKTFRDARQLILDLLGMSEKPVGERIYAAACAQIAKEHGDEPGDLANMVTFAKRWLPECFPASDEGQVHLARAVCESLIAAADGHLRRAGRSADAAQPVASEA